MTAEYGQLVLAISLLAALAQAGILLAAAQKGAPALVAAGRHAAIAAALLVLVATGLRAAGQASDDFRGAAGWGDGVGAFLLLAAAISLWSLSLQLAAGRLPEKREHLALGALGAVLAAVVAMALAIPRGAAMAAPGRVQAPDWSEPALLLGPPILALGFGGLAVAFAWAWAGLRIGRLDARWSRDCRVWALGGWIFLTAGIAVGMAGAERADSPAGRWWSWEPSQAVLLTVWLASTALLHLLSAAEKRGYFLRWAAVLALVPFPLVLAGGWLVRSGMHPAAAPFASDPGLARASLILLATIAGLGLAALVRRPSAAAEPASFEMISREAALAGGTVVLLAALAAVLIGLMQPLFAELLGLAHGVSPAYFDAAFVPLLVPALALMGLGPRLHWSCEAAREAWQDAARPAVAGSAVVAATALLGERASALLVTGLFLSTWVAWNSFEALVRRWRGRQGFPAAEPGRAAAARFHATHVAHLGVALVVAGATLSGALERVAEVAVEANTLQSAGFARVRIEGAQEVRGDGYRARRFAVRILEGGQEIVLHPEVRFPAAGGAPFAVPVIRRGLTRDLHVSLQTSAGAAGWSLRLRARPWMSLVWAGILLAAGAGVLSLGARAHAARQEGAGAPVGQAQGLAIGRSS